MPDTYARIMGRRNAKDVKEIKNALENLGGEIPGGGAGEAIAALQSSVSALVNPVSISTFTISPTGPLEVGDTLTQVQFNWNISNFAGAKSAKIRDTSSNSDVYTVSQASGNYAKTGLNIKKNSPGTQSYQLRCIDGNDKEVNSSTRTINWYYPVFYGSSSKASGLTENEIKAMTKELKANASGTYSFGAVNNSYKWLYVPESFNPTSFKSGGFDVPMQSSVTISITNEFGVSINLKGYRVTVQTSGSLDLIVS
jgi:hypothetical protein